jgi:hypothetical protein
MRWVALLLACIGLTGCAAIEARQARHALVGMSAVDVQACAGIPARIAWLDPQEQLFTYDYSATGAAISLKFLDDLSLSLGGGGGCHLVLRISGSRVAEVHYTGTTGALSGPDAACAPLVRECLRQPRRSPLPAGYDARVLAARPSARP